MDNKITLPKFATLLALKSGMSKRRCEDFLREFFIVISRSLENGDQVKVNGLGVFKLLQVEPRKSVDVSTGEPIEIPGHVKVVFTPAKELAEAVNAPFEMFEAVEVNSLPDNDEISPDNVIDEPLEVSTQSDAETAVEKEIEISISNDELSSGVNAASEVIATEVIEDETSDEITGDTDSAEVAGNGIKAESTSVEIAEPNSEVSSMAPSAATTDTQANENPVVLPPNDETAEHARHSKSRFRLGFVWGFVAGVVALGAGLYIGFRIIEHKLTRQQDVEVVIQEVQTIPVDTDSIVTPDIEVSTKNASKAVDAVMASTEVAADTKASDSPRYDTISKTRYLTTMSKEYYGTYLFWPFIYEENKDILGHPDRIRPGTKVRIPELSKYGVDPKNPADVKKAKEMGQQIYARYNKKTE